MQPRSRPTVLARLPLPERRFVLSALRDETVGGVLLLAAAVVAIVWANSPWADAYRSAREIVVGPEALHLDLSLAAWASDGLLAIFFFVAGLELKRELVVGQLSRPAQAVLPVAAALGGMVLPAAVYLAVTRGAPGTAEGWAVPVATDIAFALAVLAVIGSALPTALRAFLLTLAVVDDLGAIAIIAVFYTSELALVPLLAALVGLAAYAGLQARRVRSRWIYVPLALTVWALVHESGVHATVAGVALGLLTRVRPDPGEAESPAERLEHRLRPLSAGVAVPLFALAAAGVSVSAPALRATFADPAALGVALGLVIGKAFGVFGAAYAVARWTRASLSEDLAWRDVLGVALLSGIGFTVALLINDLAFAADLARAERTKTAILGGSLVSALLAAVVLRLRHRAHAAIAAAEGGRKPLPPEVPSGVAFGEHG